MRARYDDIKGVQAVASRKREHGIEGDAVGFESSDKGASDAAQGEASE